MFPSRINRREFIKHESHEVLKGTYFVILNQSSDGHIFFRYLTLRKFKVFARNDGNISIIEHFDKIFLNLGEFGDCFRFETSIIHRKIWRFLSVNYDRETRENRVQSPLL